MSAFEDFLPLAPREVPLGGPRGMTVHRTLPARRTSLIGAWCFVDHFGPDPVEGSGGMRVARHPHTGLATVSWLFEGAILHRDSLGSHALVRPGDVDLMVAGAGITHSEFSSPDTTVLHGVQLWYALPDARRFRDREFLVHTPAEQTGTTARIRVGLGTATLHEDGGATLHDASPVVTDTALTMVQIDLAAGALKKNDLDPGHEHGVLGDRGTGELEAGGRRPRWNFVGRTHEEIVACRARYQAEIGAEGTLAGAPVDPLTRERGGLAEDAEQFGPFAPHTPAALPAPALPHGRLRTRGRVGHLEDHPA